MEQSVEGDKVGLSAIDGVESSGLCEMPRFVPVSRCFINSPSGLEHMESDSAWILVLACLDLEQILSGRKPSIISEMLPDWSLRE